MASELSEAAAADTPPGPSSGSTLDSRRLAGAALVVMAFFVLSRATGLLREMVIGARFGTGPELDAYLAAFRIPDLLFQLVAGGALGSAFIPTFAAAWVQGDRQAAWLLFSRVLNLVVLVLVVLAGLMALLAEPLVAHVVAPGFSPAQQALTAGLMRWMLISSVVFGASGLFMGALNALQHFLLPAAAPVVYNLAIVAGAWWLAPRYGVHGLVMGVVAGAVGHLLVQVPGLVRQGARYRPSLALQDPGVREVARLMAPRVIGLFFVQLNFLVNTLLASRLPSGSLSALNFAWLLMLLPQGIFAQAMATVAFPTFAAQVAAGHTPALRRALLRLLQLMVFLTVPATLVLLVLKVPLIQILFQRGNFTPESTQAVAYALQFYALGLVAHSVVELAVRAFYALHDTRTPVAVGMAAMGLNILFSLLWIRWLSYGGLALANTVATTLEMAVLLFLLQRRLGSLAWNELARSLLRVLGVSGVMASLAWWAAQQTASAPPIGLPEGWLSGLVGLAVAGLSYLGGHGLLRTPELRWVLALVRRDMGAVASGERPDQGRGRSP